MNIKPSSEGSVGQEERLGASEGAAPRGPGRAARAARQDVPDEREADERGYQERDATENREVTEADRLEMFRDSLDQSALPDLPPMPGYHLIWLSKSNPRDTIEWRLRLGYELLTYDMTPGWRGGSLKTGELSGMVEINEMVAARLPLRLYNMYMKEVHHTKPLQDEEKLRANISLMKQEAERRGSMVEEGDGTAQIVQRARPMPEFLS